MDLVFILKSIGTKSKFQLFLLQNKLFNFFCGENSFVRSTDIVIKATKTPLKFFKCNDCFLYNCQRWIENQRGRKLQTILGESHKYCETFQEFKWQSRTTNSQLQRHRKKKEREKFLSTKEESLPSD